MKEATLWIALWIIMCITLMYLSCTAIYWVLSYAPIRSCDDIIRYEDGSMVCEIFLTEKETQEIYKISTSKIKKL